MCLPIKSLLHCGFLICLIFIFFFEPAFGGMIAYEKETFTTIKGKIEDIYTIKNQTTSEMGLDRLRTALPHKDVYPKCKQWIPNIYRRSFQSLIQHRYFSNIRKLTIIYMSILNRNNNLCTLHNSSDNKPSSIASPTTACSLLYPCFIKPLIFRSRSYLGLSLNVL